MLALSKPNLPSDASTIMQQIFDTGMLVHGKHAEAFEASLADYLGTKHVILTSSGTAALHLSYYAADLAPQDWVLVPDFTFPATASAAYFACLKPYAVDVLAGHYTMDPEKLMHTLKHWPHERPPKAIMVVHEFGAPAALADIQAIADTHGLILLEDAACALGAQIDGRKIGHHSLAACFSFHPRKTLTTGEGGAIAINDDAFAERLRHLRGHGMQRKDDHITFIEPGLNYRLTDFQAALGHAQLPHLDGWIGTRRALAEHYLACLAPLAEQGKIDLPAAASGHSWQTFMVVLSPEYTRADVVQQMRQKGFQTGQGAQSLHKLGFADADPAMTEVGLMLDSQGLALPFCEQYSKESLSEVVHALSEVLA